MCTSSIYIISSEGAYVLKEKITSRENGHVKAYRMIQSSKSSRREAGLFAAEGVRLCVDFCNSGTILDTLFFTEQGMKKYPDTAILAKKAKHTYEISKELETFFSDTKTPQGVFCLFEVPSDKIFAENISVIILESLSDPGNIGTIIRTAASLGIYNVLMTDDCCDIYSPKVLRGCMGAIACLNIKITSDLLSEIDALKKDGYTVLASVPNGNKSILDCKYQKTAIIIGNEGSGIKTETISASSQTVTIPMSGHTESLNAASAAAILMWETIK